MENLRGSLNARRYKFGAALLKTALDVGGELTVGYHYINLWKIKGPMEKGLAKFCAVRKQDQFAGIFSISTFDGRGIRIKIGYSHVGGNSTAGDKRSIGGKAGNIFAGVDSADALNGGNKPYRRYNIY